MHTRDPRLRPTPAEAAKALIALWRRHRERSLADIQRTFLPSHEEKPAAAAFRDDPYTGALLPRILGLEGFGTFLGHAHHWRADLITTLDRPTLIDCCADGLLRGGRAVETRGFWALLDDVAPTDGELAAHAADWAALTVRSGSPVAGRAG